MLVYESIKCQAIPPTCGEIANVYIWVASGLHLTPQQKCILCRLYLTRVQLLHSDVLYLSNKHQQQYCTHNVMKSCHITDVNILLEIQVALHWLLKLWGTGYCHQAANIKKAMILSSKAIWVIKKDEASTDFTS